MRLINHKQFLLYAFLFAVLLLTACETTVKKPIIKSEPKKADEKVTIQDYSKLTLKEFHDLPHNIGCKKLLSRAEQKLNKRPDIPVRVEAIKGLSEITDLDKMFYLKATPEEYPLDASIRTFSCPKKIEDVKVFYNLMQGPAYTPWHYYSYRGEVKGIDVSSPSSPVGMIESRFGDKPPEITMHLYKMRIFSLNPTHTFSNEDIDFTFNKIVLGHDHDKRISFKIYNKSQKKLKIFNIKLTIGPRDYQVNFKKNIIKLKPGEAYSGRGVKVEQNTYRWFIYDAKKPVKVIPNVLYQADSQLTNLYAEIYFGMRGLSVNQ